MENTSSYYQLAQDFAQHTNRSIFLTGKAGTGKTTFLRQLKLATKKQIAIVAPTGVAAINAGGTTLHSFFQLPFYPFIPTADGRKNLIEKTKMQGNRRKVLQELELLVIDEISMVRADVLDAVDTILRHFRYRNSEAFGGVQVIFIGDMFQLSPVASDDEWRLLSTYYRSLYFFHSQVIIQQQPIYIELDKIFRQTNKNFIKLLNEVRNNSLSSESLSMLQKQYNPFFVPKQNDNYITLTTHNYKADQINAEELSKISKKTYKFEAQIKGEYPEKSFPTERVLELKIGAKVMYLRNDTETPRRFYNGKIAIIEDIDDEIIYLKSPNEDITIELERAEWENIRYTTNPNTNQIEEEELGKFIQYPLRLAWAITIHKSQGLTFDKAIIDAGNAFAPGQVYVALSRCKSIDGIILLSKIQSSSIQNDRQIVEHEKNKLSAENLEYQLYESRNQYRKVLLIQLFDFKSIVGQLSRLTTETSHVASSFNEETIPYLNDLLNQGKALQEVASKFHTQIYQLFESNIDEEFLQNRITAAVDFFHERMMIMAESIKQSPASTDSKTKASDFNDALKTIFGTLTLKMDLMQKLKFHFCIEDYFIIKNTFKIPDLSINTYAKTSSKKIIENRNPILLQQLIELRNQLCEPKNLPIYIIAGTSSLVEMANFLPQNSKDLLKIFGFGPVKVEKYGQEFLNVITSFCKKHNLHSNMPETETTKSSQKKEKKTVGETMRITLSMYNEGLSISEIAKSRNLNTSTIASHLGKYIMDGTLDINNFINSDQRKKAITILDNNSENGYVFQQLGTFLKKEEITLLMAWIRSTNNI